jgi:hypothetical protein
VTVGDILHGIFRRKRLQGAESVEPPPSASEALAPAREPNTGAPEALAFDPGAHTVAKVLAYLIEHPEERDAVLAAEAAGKARKSILA